MNKKMVVAGLILYAVGYSLTQYAEARDYRDPEYQRQLNDTSMQQANRERVEATRAVGRDYDTTRYIIDNSGRPAGYSLQDRSGQTHFYDQSGRWSGHTDR